MDEKLKQRVVGGVVLVSLGIIAIPMFDSDEEQKTVVKEAIIPPKPKPELQTSTIDLKAWSESSMKKEAVHNTEPGTLIPKKVVEAPNEKQKTTTVNIVRDTQNQATARVAAESVARKANVQKSAEEAVVTTPQKKAEQAATAKQVAVKTERPARTTIPRAVTAVKPKPQMNSAKTGSSTWAVQVGSFSKRENAERLRKKLKQLGYRAFVSKSRSGGKTVVRVRVGPEMVKAKAKKVKSNIEKQMKMQAMLVELK